MLTLRRSRFLHQIPVGPDRVLLVHALSHLRLPATTEIAALLAFFGAPRRMPDEIDAATSLFSATGAPDPSLREAVARTVDDLMARQILTQLEPDAELAAVGAELSAHHGRDPAELLERYRHARKEGAASYWAVGSSLGLSDFAVSGSRVEAILLGDCDIQMEADFLRREAAKRGIDLRVAATFPDDLRFVAERRHDAVFVGALRARHLVTESNDVRNPHGAFIAHATHLLTRLRETTSAPIFIDNLPEPTVQPRGMAERGIAGHRTRFRLANVALAELANALPDVHVIDVAAVLGAHGAMPLLDDWQTSFTHFGSPGWLLQRPESEKAAVHGIFPDMAPLAAAIGGDPYRRETVMAEAHIDALVTVTGTGRKKCVILDLDGTLWPGVLAETGSPFAWSPEVSGGYSYIGLYFGLHEALKCLRQRGVVLACVSKNDEATVRELWRYADHYPADKLLTPDDFVTWRINWDDKVGNIRSIVEELGFAPESFLFIDDNPVERDRVRQRLPEVEVWGEDPFALRRRLLTDPRLQLPVITAEAAARSDLVKAEIGRQHLRAETLDEAAYIASLALDARCERLAPGSDRIDRVVELFQRTTQFNTAGRTFAAGELAQLAARDDACVLTLTLKDRFGDYGMVGAAVVAAGEIVQLAMSCRALGMGVEHTFMHHVIQAAGGQGATLRGRIVATARNIPVRHLYRDSGFAEVEPGVWEYRFQAAA